MKQNMEAFDTRRKHRLMLEKTAAKVAHDGVIYRGYKLVHTEIKLKDTT